VPSVGIKISQLSNADISAILSDRDKTFIEIEQTTLTEGTRSRRLHIDNLKSFFVDNISPQNVGGVKTFTSIPVLPNSDPTNSNEATRKDYVDRTSEEIAVALALALS